MENKEKGEANHWITFLDSLAGSLPWYSCLPCSCRWSWPAVSSRITARKRYRRWMPSAPWGEFHSGTVCLLLNSIVPCIDLLQRVLIRLLK